MFLRFTHITVIRSIVCTFLLPWSVSSSQTGCTDFLPHKISQQNILLRTGTIGTHPYLEVTMCLLLNTTTSRPCLPLFASGLLYRITASRDDDMMKSTMGSFKWDSTSGKGSSGFHSHIPSPGHLTVSEQGLPQAMVALAVTKWLPYRWWWCLLSHWDYHRWWRWRLLSYMGSHRGWQAALAVTQGLAQAMAALAVTLACLVLDPIRKQGQLCPPTTPTHPNACLLWTLPLWQA